MPKNTKVYRCVNYLKYKYGYGRSIAICQKSTRQNYMTGKKIRKTQRNKTHRNKTQRNKKQRNKTQRNKTQRNKTQRNKTRRRR